MKKEHILLILLPFWVPLIPPLGIACLKSYLLKQGYPVKVEDANIRGEFREIYDTYFSLLKEGLPEEKRLSGNSHFNLGHDVLHNHLMAHQNVNNEQQYILLVKDLIYKSFYAEVTDQLVIRLNQLLDTFYDRLGVYIIDLLNAEKPTIFGASIYSHTLPASLYAFKLAKKQFPGIKTVAGGGVFSNHLARGSKNLEIFLEKTPYIDKIFVGEGELLFKQYLKSELPSSQKVFTLEDVQGEYLDLSNVDVPDFSDLSLQYYPDLPTYTSRSCPFQCSFCSETLQWGNFRKKKAAQIVRELKTLYQRHHTQLFWMCDSLLNPVITGLSKEILESGLSLYWDGYLRADKEACNTENTMLWRRGGFYRARMGVESGSQRVLDLMNKKITIERTKQTVTSLAYAGIKTTTYWVVGHQGETEEDFQSTLDLISELQDDIYEAMCNPFNYYLNGQVNSSKWEKEYKSIPLYLKGAEDMLMIPTWIMNCEPSREEAYDRVRRFEEHCRKLGIPNPYSLSEINQADERWKKRHKNAVPSLMEFKKGDTIQLNESKTVSHVFVAEDSMLDDGEFGF